MQNSSSIQNQALSFPSAPVSAGQALRRPTPPGATLHPATVSLKGRHFLTGAELSRAELMGLLELAALLKSERPHRRSSSFLEGTQLALYFEKPSLRTRVSFSVAIQELGGNPIEVIASNTKGEDPEDTARVLHGYVHAIMARTFSHETLERMTKYSKVPVINGLSDLHHPCQGLADLLTIKEHFPTLDDIEVTYVGDGNNILHSLLLLAPVLGLKVRYVCPKGYGPNPSILGLAKHLARENGGAVERYDDLPSAVKGTHAVYTDVWTSMGFESESAARERAFKGYQVNEALMDLADPQAIVLHCLPMIRGKEISATLPEDPRSAIFQQSENRLHVQKALLLALLQ